MYNSQDCITTFISLNGKEKIIYNLPFYQYQAREYIDCCCKEIMSRIEEERSTINISYEGYFCIGATSGKNIVLLFFKKEQENINLLINLCRRIILTGKLENINTMEDVFSSMIEIEILNTIEETKNILYDDLNKLLKRGEKIETIIEKTTYLSKSAKVFYQKSKKFNTCCIIL